MFAMAADAGFFFCANYHNVGL